MELLIIIILSILLIASLYVNFNIFQKLKIYEAWIQAYARAVVTILENMKEIDKNGAFEEDDEVGNIFRQLKSQILVLQQFGVSVGGE